MSPGNVVHGVIQATFGSLIRQRLRASGSPHVAMIRPAIKPRLCAQANIRVPDIGVARAPFDAGRIIAEDPILLVEVLSPSNKGRTWTNVWAYTTIPSVREIVVVHSEKIEVQILRPSAERIWPDNPETRVMGDTLRLESIGLTCPVDAIYSDTPLA